VLKGALGGTAISVALPFLDCFLNSNGSALAATGAPLPVRFGTWFWGLGHTPGRGVSNKMGQGIEFLEECKALVPYREHINYFSNFNTPLDGKVSLVHFTGWVACRTGEAPGRDRDVRLPTLDVLIGDTIGAGSRFRSLDISCTGNPKDSYTFRSAGAPNTAEVSPVSLYARVFGPEFVDPNKGDFKPDPNVVLRKSVLSAVNEQSKQFIAGLGAEDKARIDQYFTSIRQLENNLAAQLKQPERNAACQVPAKPVEGQIGTEVGFALANHKLMTDLLVLALACNQTRMFNMLYSDSGSSLRLAGTSQNHHNLTHEEPTDPKLGYQVIAARFATWSMEAFAYFIDAFSKVREGDGTLLDNTFIFANSDTSYAKIHLNDNIPMMTVGKAGGRLKTGLHIDGGGNPLSRVGFTALQVMGVPIEAWGTGALRTSKAITEIIA
jgi:hypothetical protein